MQADKITAKEKGTGKEGKIITRVPEDLKNAFDWACDVADQTGSQVLRRAMRDLVSEVFDRVTSSIALDGSVPDSRTGILYDPKDEGDVRLVKRTIYLQKKFMELHPEVPLVPYAEREAMKKAARKVLHDEFMPVKEREEALLNLIKAHYIRSAESFLSTDDPLSYTRHPGFDEYVKHYLHAGSVPESAAIEKALQKRYPLKGPSTMKPGSSYWGSALIEAEGTA